MLEVRDKEELRKVAEEKKERRSVMGHAKGSRYTRTGRAIVRPHKRLKRRTKKELSKS